MTQGGFSLSLISALRELGSSRAFRPNGWKHGSEVDDTEGAIGETVAPRIGFLVTWDVDSSDAAAAARLRRFVYGDMSVHGGKVYRRPGFVERNGVRYLGQSVLFVRPPLLGEIQGFLESHRIDHEVTSAAIG